MDHQVVSSPKRPGMNDSVKCIVVLGVICLVVAVLLAAINFVTGPIIDKAATAAVQGALRQVLSDATEFDRVVSEEEYPESVQEIWRDQGGAGYAFVVHAAGYGGDSSPIVMIVGIDGDGIIRGVAITDVKGETAGIGDKVASDSYLSSFVGSDSLLKDVSVITGATYSSNGVISGVKDAFAAFFAVADVEETDEQKLARLLTEALPGAKGLAEYVPADSAVPSHVLRAYKAANGVGYVVVCEVGETTVLVAIDPFGRVVSATDLDKLDLIADASTAPAIAEAKEFVASSIVSEAEKGKTYLTAFAGSGADLTRLDSGLAFPASVTDAYRIEQNGDTFFGFILTGEGEKGTFRIALLLDSFGSVTKIRTISHEEGDHSYDPGRILGDPAYYNLYVGKTGETVMTDTALTPGGVTAAVAYRDAVATVFTAYQLAKEVQA